MKILDFLKTNFFSMIFTFIYDLLLNSDNKEIWRFGLCWPLWPWLNFIGKNWPLLIEIKHNWPVSINQMSKSISISDQAFTTYLVFWMCTKVIWRNVGDEWATDQPNPDFVGLKGIENLIIITFPIIRFLAIIHMLSLTLINESIKMSEYSW